MSESPLAGRRLVLGVTGSIAAYKAVYLLRALRAEGAEVQVAMTYAARRFLGELTMETLSGRRVQTDPLELEEDARIAHIVAAEEADAIVVAPATARWMAAMAAGLSDDPVTAICLASAAPVVVAPAMDGGMYAHPATQRNRETLTGFGYLFVEPETGPLASGSEGRGRLAEPDRIIRAVRAALDRGEGEQAAAGRRDLAGRRVVVTAGGTQEPIDPVRFIGNRSSGRMGVAIARAAAERGARVLLVHGEMSVEPPQGVETLRATSAEEMHDAVLGAMAAADVLVMAAAVADFRAREPMHAKLTRGQGLSLELEPTPDILAEVAQAAGRRSGGPRPVLVGFAAETGSLDRATAKATRKGVDILVANDVLRAGSGFATETNEVTLIRPGRPPEPWPLMAKREVATRLVDLIAEELARRGHVPTEVPA